MHGDLPLSLRLRGSHFIRYHRLTLHRQDLFGQVRELEGLYEYFVLSCDIVPPERDPLHIESKGI